MKTIIITIKSPDDELITRIATRMITQAIAEGVSATMADADGQPLASTTLSLALRDTGLSTRTLNLLVREGVRTIGDLTDWNGDQLLSIQNFGLGCLLEIMDITERLGIRLDPPRGHATAFQLARQIRDLPRPEWTPSITIDTPIQASDLPTRVANLLIIHGSYSDGARIRLIGDLCAYSEDELLAFPGIGQRALQEIKDLLESLGKSLKA